MKVMCIIDVRNLFHSLHQHAVDITPVNAEVHTVQIFQSQMFIILKLLNSKNTEETSIRNSI